MNEGIAEQPYVRELLAFTYVKDLPGSCDICQGDLLKAIHIVCEAYETDVCIACVSDMANALVEAGR